MTEFQLAFGFPLRTLMVPLEGTSPPGEPGAARKRFTFVDPQGREVWKTSLYPVDEAIFTVDDDVFSIYDEIFTDYDVGA